MSFEDAKKEIYSLKKYYTAKHIAEILNTDTTFVWRRLNGLALIDINFCLELEKNGLIGPYEKVLK